jgi:hypothetical protein
MSKFGPPPRYTLLGATLRPVQAVSLLQQVRQLGDVDGDAPGFVLGDSAAERRPGSYSKELAERLPVLVAGYPGRAGCFVAHPDRQISRLQ